jgi:hypothetical protein
LKAKWDVELAAFVSHLAPNLLCREIHAVHVFAAYRLAWIDDGRINAMRFAGTE